jgi:hypothetical protein
MMWGAAHRCSYHRGRLLRPDLPEFRLSFDRGRCVGCNAAPPCCKIAPPGCNGPPPGCNVAPPGCNVASPCFYNRRRPVATWRRPVATPALVCSTRGDRHRLRLEHAPRLVARAEGARSSSSALGFWWPTKVRWNYLLCACACARFAGNNGFSATCAVAATIIIRQENRAAAARPAGHSGVLTGTHT